MELFAHGAQECIVELCRGIEFGGGASGDWAGVSLRSESDDRRADFAACRGNLIGHIFDVRAAVVANEVFVRRKFRRPGARQFRFIAANDFNFGL